MANLSKKLDKIPSSPGVYLFKDKRGRVLYVGKSANLKVRVRSYFHGGGISYNPLKQKLLAEIADVETRETPSEVEALVLEAQLIKKLKPRFNVLMRDNKNYGWVVITNEEYPRILVSHQPTTYNLKPKNLIGPFTEVKPLKRTLRLLRTIFPYYTKRRHSSVERQMGLVPPDDVSAKEYGENINSVKKILTGKKKILVRALKRQISQAAGGANYEQARMLKEKLDYIQSVIDHASVLGQTITAPSIFADERPNFKLLGLSKEPALIEAYDISNIGGQEAVGSMVVFEQRADGSYGPAKAQYRKFKIKTVKGANDPAMIAEVVSRRLNHPDWPRPDLIVVDGGKAQLNAALRALRKRPIRIIALAKRQEDVYFPERKNPIRADSLGQATKHLLQSLRDETHRFAIQYHRLRHRKLSLD